jgi:uncharacterized membrane protein
MSATNPSPPPEPRPPSSGQASGAPGTSTGLDPKIAGLLAYLVGWVSGTVLFLVEKEHLEVRFHAAQSILLSIAFAVVYVVLTILGFIPILGLVFWLVSLLVGLAGFALWIYLLVQGYNLNHVRLPVVGRMAEQWAAR